MLQEIHSRLEKEKSVTISMRVHPSARRTQIKEILDDGSIKIDLAAPPEDGKANEELVELLSEEFGLPKRNIQILSGHTTKIKVVRLHLQ